MFLLMLYILKIVKNMNVSLTIQYIVVVMLYL